MFCSKCGKEVHDDAVVCTSCGCSIGKKEQVFDESVGEDKASGGLIAVSILIPIVGVILGIVNLCKSKKKSGTTYLVAGTIAWVVYVVLLSTI